MTSKLRAPALITLLLLLAFNLAGVPAPGAAQKPQRERRANLPSTQTPAATPTPAASPGPTPVQQSVLSPAPAASRRPVAITTKTLVELQARISDVLRRPELTQTMIALKVVSLDTSRIIFEENAHKLLRPASNMKLYTIAAALDRLSPDFRFTTSVYAPSRPDAAGIIHGDLTIYGRGDPSIAARFNNGDYFKAVDDLASRIVAAGVKRVEGDLVGDETYFTGPEYGSGWSWEDLQWWYGTEVSALTVNDNALDLFIKPGPTVGAPALVTTGPPDPLLTVMNRVTTGPKGSKRDLTVYRGLGNDILQVSGSMPLDDRGYSGSIGITHPALLFVYLLRSSLAERGVTVRGHSRTVAADPTGGISVDPAQFYSLTHLTNVPQGPPVEITSMQSPPLSVIAAQTLKPSQNLYTELILRTLGKVGAKTFTPSDTLRTSENAGLSVVKSFLRQAGVASDSLLLTDGSGLSRDDMVTADATVQLLTYMTKHRYASIFRDALPIAGVDGTLKNRMKGTAAENNLRAKTGTLSSAASLSGYVTSVAGEKLVFSIMVNNYSEDVEMRAICIDPIALLLASFAGKT
jgi:serine-type D-Ala-D-Ala carboxypeptidase/endopeptidase (penicillin-binding protein 4)